MLQPLAIYSQLIQPTDVLGSFDASQLSPEEVDDLRRRVVAGDPGDSADYPVQLFQCVDRGPDHNRAPILEEQSVPLADGSVQQLRYVRYYLDGMTAYLYLARKLPIKPELLGIMLGYTKPTFVIAQRFSESRAAANLLEVMKDYARHAAPGLQLRQTQIASAVRAALKPNVP